MIQIISKKKESIKREKVKKMENEDVVLQLNYTHNIHAHRQVRGVEDDDSQEEVFVEYIRYGKVIVYVGRYCRSELDFDESIFKYISHSGFQLHFELNVSELKRKLDFGQPITHRTFLFNILYENKLSPSRASNSLKDILLVEAVGGHNAEGSHEAEGSHNAETSQASGGKKKRKKKNNKLFPFQEKNVKWMLEVEHRGVLTFEVPNSQYYCIDGLVFDFIKNRILDYETNSDLFSLNTDTFWVQGGGLFDESGLGKTRCVIELALKNKMEQQNNSLSLRYKLKSRATLVLCPDHLIYHWRSEIRHRDMHSVVIILSNPYEWQRVTYNDIMYSDFILMSYNFLADSCHFDCDISTYGILTNSTLQTMAIEKFRSNAFIHTTSPCLLLFRYHRVVFDEYQEILPSDILAYLSFEHRWFISSNPCFSDKMMTTFLRGISNFRSNNSKVPDEMVPLIQKSFRRNLKNQCGIPVPKIKEISIPIEDNDNDHNSVTPYPYLFQNLDVIYAYTLEDLKRQLTRYVSHQIDTTGTRLFKLNRIVRTRERYVTTFPSELSQQRLDQARLNQSEMTMVWNDLKKSKEFIEGDSPNDESQGIHCPICLQNECKTFVSTICGHRFCTHCILQWCENIDKKSRPIRPPPQTRTTSASTLSNDTIELLINYSTICPNCRLDLIQCRCERCPTCRKDISHTPFFCKLNDPLDKYNSKVKAMIKYIKEKPREPTVIFSKYSESILRLLKQVLIEQGIECTVSFDEDDDHRQESDSPIVHVLSQFDIKVSGFHFHQSVTRIIFYDDSPTQDQFYTKTLNSLLDKCTKLNGSAQVEIVNFY